jgi:transposase
MYPTGEQEQQMLPHCAHARYVWNLAVEQHSHWQPGRADLACETRARGLPRHRNRPHTRIRAGRQPQAEPQDRQAGHGPRVTFRNGQWHIAFAVIDEPIDAPGSGEVIGIDRGVKITAALSDGRKLNCPRLTAKERAQIRKLSIKNMTRSAKGTVEQPGRNVRQKAGLNRGILAQGWGLLRQRTEHKAPGRVEDVPAPFTSLRCSACGWIEKNSRKSQAEFVCVSCGFTCNADENAATNVAAGQGGIPSPRRTAGAGGVTAATSRSSAREPQPTRVGIPLF